MLVLLTVANRRSQKREGLAEASGRLDALRITLRLSQRLGYLSNGGYAQLTGVADEVGRMLGGWLKHQTAAEAPPSAPPRRRRGGVRYTMTSPTIERYLRLKLEHPKQVVFVVVGTFCQTFFEDAALCGRELRLAVQNRAADSEPEKIPSCGFPLRVREKYTGLLRQRGWEAHVEG
jgi:hypothetical protein